MPNVGVYHILKREGREHGQIADSPRKVDVVLEGGLRSLELAHHKGVIIAYASDLL